MAGLIIDMRYNNGGANLGLAGFLTDQEIPLGQLEYYSETSGKFEPEGAAQKVLPNQNQYRFDKMVLLVGPACYSACEIEAYGFSQVPGHGRGRAVSDGWSGSRSGARPVLAAGGIYSAGTNRALHAAGWQHLPGGAGRCSLRSMYPWMRRL